MAAALSFVKLASAEPGANPADDPPPAAEEEARIETGPGDRVESIQKRAWDKRGTAAVALTLAQGIDDPFLIRGGAGLRATAWPRALLGFALEASAWTEVPSGSARVAQRELRARLRPAGTGLLLLASAEISAADGKVAVRKGILPFEVFLRAGAGPAFSGTYDRWSAAFGGGAGVRWFFGPRFGVELALAWRSAAVHREVAGRIATDREVVVALELGVPLRFGAAPGGAAP